ncbi:MAG: ferritin-like domain-containing protein [Thermoleophilaceae bacterium]
MSDNSLEEQLVKYLTDVHSIEQQALAQLRVAPDMAGDPEIAEMFRAHERETEEQKRLIEQRLEAHGASPSKLKDVAGTVTGKGFALFAKANPDTPGKLAAHAHSYEAMEEAAYEQLYRIAERAGDQETAQVAQTILEQEKAMKERLRGAFDRSVEAALREVSPDDLEEQLVKYLTDAHAIEAQAIQLLQKSPKVVDEPNLAKLFEDHLEETEAQQELVKTRLEAHGASPNKLQDAAMRLGALNWGAFFTAQPDTPGKLAGFAYAFEHLEIAGYEQLKRVAEKAGDQETVRVAERIIGEEQAAANSIAANWEAAVDATLSAVGAVA